MKNFLSKYYKHYYIQTDDGECTETTRAECLAQGDNPTADNPYKQRWFYDGEQFSYIVRLPRNEQGEPLYRMNATDVKKEERYLAQRFTCVLKNTGDCDNDCENCQRKRYARTVELDKPLAGDSENDDEPHYLEIAVDDCTVEIEDKDILEKALAQLLPQQRELIEKIFYEGYTVQEFATTQGVDKSAISHRLQRAYKKLKTFLD